jgi:hypothetical protein
MNFSKRLLHWNRFDLEIEVPRNLEIVSMEHKVLFRGSSADIAAFAQAFFQFKSLKDGALCKLDRYTLKVSDNITEDGMLPNWIELPGHAWVIMGSKFQEVAFGHEQSPFDFNDSGSTDPIPFDIGVEVVDWRRYKPD